MRLLHTKTLAFSFFFEHNRPPYQILSHTWTEHETSFVDFNSALSSDRAGLSASPNPGIQKVLGFCDYAALNGCDWVWIDTCCINKESSAELSEAINSMYKWYQGAEKCVVYLSDVNLYEEDQGARLQLENSRWFTRGWTLQELIAPRKAVFLDCNWVEFGSKDTMSTLLSDITGIREEILSSNAPRETVLREPIATRMSWASRRVTTRPEDIAYCLLGIFNMNMSLLYGEGSNAFLRLQRKLAKRSVDESLFAWTEYICPEQDDYCGLFAPHPAAFRNVDWIRPSLVTCRPIVQNSRGMEVPVYNKFFDEVKPGQESVFPLNCVDHVSRLVGITLVKLHGRWYRRTQRDLITLTNRSTIMTIFEKHELPQGTAYLEATAERSDRTIRRRKKTRATDDLPQQAFLRFNNQIPEPLSLLISIDEYQVNTLTRPLKFIYYEILAAQQYFEQKESRYRDDPDQPSESETVLDPLLFKVLRHMGKRTVAKRGTNSSLMYLTHSGQQEAEAEAREDPDEEDRKISIGVSTPCLPRTLAALLRCFCG